MVVTFYFCVLRLHTSAGSAFACKPVRKAGIGSNSAGSERLRQSLDAGTSIAIGL